MENDYEIGVNFVLNTDILDALGLVSDKLMDIQQLIAASSTMLTQFNDLSLSSIASARKIASAWARVSRSVDKATVSLADYSSLASNAGVMPVPLPVKPEKSKEAAQESGAALGSKSLMAGGLMLGGSYVALGIFGDTLKDAGAMQRQIAIQQGAGIAAAQIALNTKASWKAANSVTDVSPQQAMGAITMLRSLLGNSAEARTALDPVLKTEVGLQAALGPQAAASLVQGLKALDISGGMVSGTQISVEKMLGLLPYIAQAMVQTHGILTGAQILRMMQQAGPAASATSFKNLIEHMAEVTAAVGTGAGRGLYQAYMATSVGRVSAVSASYMEKLGLLKASDLHKVKGSSTYLFDPSKLYGAKYLQQNGLVDWIHNKIVPYLQKRGDKTPQELIRDLTGLLPATTAARVAAYIINNMPQIDRTQDNIEKGVKTGALYTSAQKTWPIELQNFQKAWTTLLTSLGMPVIKQATGVLIGIAGAIHEFGSWMGAHPTYAKLIEDGLLGLGVGIGVLGAIFTGAAVVAIVGTGGIIAALVAGIAAFAAILMATNWKQVVGGVTVALDAVWQAITGFVHDIAYAAMHPLADLRHIGHDVAGVFDGSGTPPSYEHAVNARRGWPDVSTPTHGEHEPKPVYLVHEPVVHVGNPDALHGATARALAKGLSVQTGPTGHNAMLSPPFP